MARPKKETKPQIVNTVLRVTTTIDFPIATNGDYIDLMEKVKSNDVYSLVNDYSYDTTKSKGKLVIISTDLDTDDALELMGLK